MNLEIKGNPNYVATVVQIENIVPLAGCDSIQATNIFGNNVIVSKDVKVGNIGLFFPVETKLSKSFIYHNSLYRDKNYNQDKEKSGFFENNGRIRCVKLRGHKSEGFWIPVNSLISFLSKKEIDSLKIGQEFDHINNVKICEKYVIQHKEPKEQLSKKDKRNRKLKRFNRLIDNQFRFHIDTYHLGKYIDTINRDQIISITTKLHGTSGVFSYILCNKKLSIKDKIAKFFGVSVIEREYDYIYSSRKIIKNKYINHNSSGYYTEDIWKIVNNELKPYLQKGMTIYSETVGFLPKGGPIQKKYDYGCEQYKHETYIYRITTTNEDGKVFEWSMLHIQQWCAEKGLKAVPLLYYGYTKDLFENDSINNWNQGFLEYLQETYLDKVCNMCKNKVPEEGIVLRIESLDIEAYKLKSFSFVERESKKIDAGEFDIEEEN